MGNYFSSASFSKPDYTRARDPMTDNNEMQSLADYLSGRTPRCPGYNMIPAHGCGRRVPTMAAPLCDICAKAKDSDDFKTECAKPNDKWYDARKFYGQSWITFVCRTCGGMQDARNVGVCTQAGEKVPVAACCTRTRDCAAAKAFWGDVYDYDISQKIDTYVRHSGKNSYLRP